MVRMTITEKTILILALGLCLTLLSNRPVSAQASENAAAESYNLGIQAAQKGDTVDAITYYNAAITADANYADAYFNLGSVYFAQGNFIESAKNFKKVTELNPSSAEGFANYGKVLFAQEKYDDALAAYTSALAADPNHFEAVKELGKLHYKKGGKQNPGAFDKAIEMLEKYLKHDSTDSYSYYLNAMAYKQKKNNSKAIENFQKAIKYDPENFESFNSLAGIYLTQQSYTQAIDNFEKALKLKPKNYRTARNLAIAVQSRDPENYEAAIAAWENFLKIARGNSAAQKYVTQAEQLVKDLKDAKAISGDE